MPVAWIKLLQQHGRNAKTHVLCRYKFTETKCIHGKTCKTRKEGRECRIGMRFQRTQLITGTPLRQLRASLCLHNAYVRLVNST